MTPGPLRDFFIAAAGVGGTLVGLLFVAISVSRGRLTEEHVNQGHRVRAYAALTSFTNALTVALFALVPDVGLRWPAFVVGCLGLVSVVASVLSLVRVRGLQRAAAPDVLFLAGLVAVFILQIVFAVDLIRRAGDTGAASGIAILVIVCFLIGIARAWELVGGPSMAISREVAAAVRSRDRHDG
jgi:predicted membrane-bound spermidine synthase